MFAGGPGSIPGADKRDSGFHPSGVVKMRSTWYVDGWPLQNIANVNRAAVRLATCWLMQSEAQTTTRGFFAVSAGVLKVYVCDTKAPKKFSDIYIYFNFQFRTNLSLVFSSLECLRAQWIASYLPMQRLQSYYSSSAHACCSSEFKYNVIVHIM